MEANINQCIFQTSKKLKISPKEIIDIIVTQKMNRKIRLSFLAFTDGACKHNPGPGGWGITYMHRIKDVKIYWSDNGGKKHTTNSEMELTAMKKLLDFVPKGHDYLIHVDSHYVLHSIIKGNDGSVALKNNIPYFSGWMGNWIKNNWKTIGIVGTRNPSNYSKEAAFSLAKRFVYIGGFSSAKQKAV